MAPRRKSPEVLDTMIEHVRYEIEQTMLFVTIGNGWSEILRDDIFLRQLRATSPERYQLFVQPNPDQAGCVTPSAAGVQR